MFTGIIQSLGQVSRISSSDVGMQLEVDISGLVDCSVNIGDSIAINGMCMTVTELTGTKMTGTRANFDVSSETVSKCLVSQWQQGDQVNLETALTLKTPIGGHLVSGHVDGYAQLQDITHTGEFTRMKFSLDKSLGKFVAEKGSIALQGVSLTTNTVEDDDHSTYFEVMLVPHTLSNTTLGLLQPKGQVHIEVDQIARYIHRLESFTLSNHSDE